MGYALTSSGAVKELQRLYAQCKQMMEVTDEDIEAYRKERKQIDKGKSEDDEAADSLINEIIQLQMNIDESKAKLKLE